MAHPSPIRDERMIHNEKPSAALRVAVAWLIVLIPLGWGVVQSVTKSLPLFQIPDASGRPMRDGRHRVADAGAARPLRVSWGTRSLASRLGAGR